MNKSIEIKHHPPGTTPENARSQLNMDFGSVKGARVTLENLAAAFVGGEISERQARALVYVYNGILAALKLETDMRIEERLEAIEEKVNERL